MLFNNSAGRDYYSQRNNRIRPTAACQVTAYLDALEACQWPLPDTGKEQPEDALLTFIETDWECLKHWREIGGPNPPYPPNEYHDVLCFGVNKWMGKPVSQFRTSASTVMILSHLLARGCVVMSGKFPSLRGGHVVAVVGADYANPWRDRAGALIPGAIKSFIIDDPWGDYRKSYGVQRGNDIVMPFADFEAIMKPENAALKWAHFVAPYGAPKET